MKWSKQKCRNVAFVVALCYVLLGILFFHIVEHIEDNIYLSKFLLTIFYPVVIPYFVVLFLFDTNIIPIFVIILLLIIWAMFYGIIWLIKGEKS